MGLGDCIEQTLNNVTGVLDSTNNLFNPNAFVNPQLNIINGLRTSGFDTYDDVQAAIGALIPLSPTYAVDLQNLQDLSAAIVSLTGSDGPSFLLSKMGQYQYYTDFLSGKIDFFPVTQMEGILGQVPMSAILGTMTFASLMGAAAGIKAIDSSTCKTDPDDPCGRIAGIFGSVLGAFNTVLNAMQAGLNLMTNFVENAVAYITQIIGWVVDMVGWMVDQITKLVAAVIEGLRYGLAKLLKALHLDPCFAQVLENIASAPLKIALGT